MSLSDSRKTLKDFLISKNYNSDSISYTIKNDGIDGLGVDPNTNKELLNLENDIEGLLGDYLKFLVDNSKNFYKIKGGNEKSSSSDKGDSLTLPDLQGAENIFLEQGTELKNKFNENANSGYFDNSGTNLNTLIDKIGNNFSNHEKLKEIQGRNFDVYGNVLVNPNGENNNIVQATQKMFLKNNRFANVGNNSKKSFTDKPQSVEQFESRKESTEGSVTIQNKFGKFDIDQEKVYLNDLKEIAASLLFKASGFDMSDSISDSLGTQDVIDNLDSLYNANITENNGITKINTNNLKASNAKGFPTNNVGQSLRDGRGNIIDDELNANNNKTFGVTYNSEFKFLDKNLKFKSLQAAATLIAIRTIGTYLYSNIIDMIREKDRIHLESEGLNYISENSGAEIYSYMLGKSKNTLSNKLNYQFSSIFASTSYPFGNCIDKGIAVLYGNYPLNKKSISDLSLINESSGFWLAVSKSILKSFDDSLKDIDNNISIEEKNYLFYSDILSKNKIIRFFNVLAMIGEISLNSTGGVINDRNNKLVKNPRDIDDYPDSSGVIGKSRKKDGLYKNELSYNQDEVPSMYILPANIIRAANKLSNNIIGESPVRGLFGSKLIKSVYTGIDVDGSYNKIPNDVVKNLEDRLDAEYVPFYIQDLRTNEILSFHAFLDSLTDTITPSYSPVDGYGRMDNIQIYKNTSRTIQCSFNLFSTNREDFDSMWYKINKFTTLLYPQWTPGTLVGKKSTSTKFYQPFSQVIGASPVVRLRIGDVIKSNYSRFNLARIFGIGDTNIKVSNRQDEILKNKSGSIQTTYVDVKEIILKTWLSAFGSPISTIGSMFPEELPNNDMAAKKFILNQLSNYLINGFANPLAVSNIINRLTDPNMSKDSLINGYTKFSKILLKPNNVNGYYCEESGKKYLIPRRLYGRVIEKSNSLGGMDPEKNYIGYKILIDDFSAPKELLFKNLIVKHTDIYPDPKEMFNFSLMGGILNSGNLGTNIADSIIDIANDYAVSLGIPNDLFDLVRSTYVEDESDFMEENNNPFSKAFSISLGRGIAGTLSGVTFDWLSNDFPWEIDYNARAPMGVKIGFSLNVLHDIPPGLDHSGFNRSPLYNVGEVMRNISGDVYRDNGRKSEFNYRNQGSISIKGKGNS